MKWWEKAPSILSGDFENIYGLNDDVTKSEVKYLINEASIPPQSNILDLCCGTGRHSIHLAELGYYSMLNVIARTSPLTFHFNSYYELTVVTGSWKNNVPRIFK